MGTSFRDFAEVFFQLSDRVLFSTFVGLLPLRVFPFFPFLYASFCLPALSPIFNSKNSAYDASVFSSLLAADLCLTSHSPAFVCITAFYFLFFYFSFFIYASQLFLFLFFYI